MEGKAQSEYLVTVILLWVVGGSYHDSSTKFQMQHSVGLWQEARTVSNKEQDILSVLIVYCLYWLVFL